MVSNCNRLTFELVSESTSTAVTSIIPPLDKMVCREMNFGKNAIGKTICRENDLSANLIRKNGR